MNQYPNYYCLILAGGLGSRLWPSSREHKPKQFLDFEGSGVTLLQQTYNRFVKFIPKENIFVSTQETYLPIVQEQLPQLTRQQILAEPVRRGTLAPVTWATSAISHINPEACIAVTPADQVIYSDELFADNLLQALNHVSKNQGVVTLGVPPTRPEVGYGYVQMGEPIDAENHIYQVKTFTEKPDIEFAKMFMDSGEFLWNTGLFVFGVHYMLHNIIKHVPEYADMFPELTKNENHLTTLNPPQLYAALPNLSMEFAVLEHTGHNYVQRCRFGWADLGTWEGIATDAMRALSPGSPQPKADLHVDGNENITIRTEAIFDNSSGNIVRLPKGHIAAISGLNGFVVVESEGVIMICPKDDASAMRRLQTLAHLDDFDL